MLQLSRSGIVLPGSNTEIEQARAHFEQHDWIRFPAILDGELWKILQQQLAVTNFDEDTGSIYQDLTITDGTLLILLNNARLFKVIEQITGCGHIGCFRGRAYRIVPGASYHTLLTEDQTAHEILTGWHTDLSGTKLVALTINLNTEPYQGGVLSIRETSSKRVLCDLTNFGLGDAILFRIDERLEHRVSDVEGTVSKTAFSGWFESEPDYRTLLAKGIARSQQKTGATVP
jgi:hypothetical protein